MMNINDTNCILCDNPHNSNKFNVKEHTTSQTFTVLLHYLEYVVGEKVVLNNNHNICLACFDLINEIEKIEIKAKELKRQLTDLYTNYKNKCESQIFIVSDFPLQDISDNLIQDRLIISNNAHEEVQEELSKFKPVFECPLCHKKFVHKSRVEAHIKKFHPNVEENCEIVFKTEFKTEQETVAVNDNKINNSYEINILQQNEIIVNEKEQEVKEEKPQEEKAKIQKSRGRKKIIEPKVYACSECPKKWKTQSELKTHIISHSDVRPFICEICGQAYKHKTALDVHVGMHNGINPFMCVYCNKAFTQRGGLMRHIAIHTGDKHHQCDLCGKRFIHHTSFNIHRLSHTGQKDYKCNVCGLALMSGSHLKRHMRCHTGEKKFACSICNKRFAEKYNLAAHEKLHDSNAAAQKRKYRCQMCPNSYHRKVKLDEHIAKEHENNMDPQHVENTPDQPISTQPISVPNEYEKCFMADRRIINDPIDGQSIEMHNQYLKSLNIYTDNTM